MSKTIVLIEDDISIIEVVTLILQDEGYSVVAFPVFSLERIKDIRPSLILLDRRIGGIDGQDIARTLQSDSVTASIPCVLLSADAQSGTIAKKLHIPFLEKPFDIDDLVAIVKQQTR